MSKKNNRYFEFDNFRADTQQKCLWHGTELVSLTPKSFDTLLVLIENKGRIVDKETLLNEVWGETFVEDEAVRQNISTLRKKFDSLQTGKEFIETVPRRGYRFVGEVREIFGEEEVFVVETRTRTHIVANQEIHLSGETKTEASTLLHSITKNRKLLAIGALTIVTVFVVSLFAFRYYFQARPMVETKFRQFEIKQITASGNIHKVAISPDGKYIAFVERKNDLSSVFLRQTDSSNNVEIIAQTKDDIFGITFSPSNDSLFYTAYPSSGTSQIPRIGVLRKIPILGGTSAEILKNIDSPVSISPDGNKYSFIRNKFAERQSTIVLYDSTRNENQERVLATREIRDWFCADRVAWSPDGKKIVAGANSTKDAIKPFEIVVVDVESGKQNILSNEKWSWLGQIAWLADNSGVILTALSEDSPNFTDEVWTISFPNGETKKITNGINGFYGLGATADSNTLVTVKSNRISEIVTSPKKKLGQSKVIQRNINNLGILKYGMDSSSDKKIVYSTSQLGNADIWMMDFDAANQKQITNQPSAELFPTVSKDGRYIVFISNRSGTKNIWKMNLDGTNQVQLTNFQNVFSPSLSPDNIWIYFAASSEKSTRFHLWRVSINGGEPQQLTNLMTIEPKISPNGKFIACYYPENGEHNKPFNPLKLSILSTEDYSIIKQFDVLFSDNNSQFAWTSDSNGISYTVESNGDSSIFLQSVNGGEPQKVFTLPNENIFNHLWSNNAEILLLEKGTIINDIVLLKNNEDD